MSTTNTAERVEAITFDQIRIGDQLRVTLKDSREGGMTVIREGAVAKTSETIAYTANGQALAWRLGADGMVIERIGAGPRERAIEAMARAFFGGHLEYSPYRRGEPDADMRSRRLARMAEAYDTLPQAARDAIEGGK